ncbi:MAG TPA: prepilin-type N-terminal cleavage/methylation domain-containing protein [Gammaproteobacteria bacterium]|nr:prepilin-type N-terminal cleavage/methylation domain-containing protein [Gammaproteobacteria bacterium]
MSKSLKGARGFSLIELMVVIVIAAVLSALAIPSYQSYIGKARAAEITSMIGPQLEAWSVYNQTGTALPATLSGANSPSPYITSITFSATASSAVVVVLSSAASAVNANIAGATLTFAATVGTGSTTWACTAAGQASPALTYPSPGPLQIAGTAC